MKPVIVSLYSFKGGAGRTVCTANLAPRLAALFHSTAKSPLVLVDLDLDSAGLTFLLEENANTREDAWSASMLLTGELSLTLLAKRRQLFDKELQDVSTELKLGSEGKVLFLRAGAMEKQIGASVGARGLIFLETLIDSCEERDVPVLLIDSASGLQQTAVLSHKVSDVVVYCCRLTRQFVRGTKQHLELMLRRCAEDRTEPPKILLLPVAVPQASPRWADMRTHVLTQLRTICAALPSQVQMASAIIGEIERFKWTEDILQDDTNAPPPTDEAEAILAFQALAEQVHRLASSSTQDN